VFTSIDNPIFQVTFSSGSTGLPKGIPIKFSKLYSNGMLFSRFHEINQSIKMLNILPLAYLGGWYNMFLIPFINEGQIFLDKPFGSTNLYSFWETVIDKEINCLWLNPMIMSMLSRVGLDEEVNPEKINIKWGFVGMAPLNQAVQEKFSSLFPVELKENYGLSETFFIASDKAGENLPKGAIGKVLDGVDVQIVEDEIVVKSPYMFEGYFESNQKPIKDGFFPTGDLGKVEDGYLFITGRKKDIVIRGGINISPKEIEEVLLEHVEIDEAAVIGIEHEFYGEALGAIIRSDSLTVKDIKKFLKPKLSKIKIPDLIQVVDEIPRNKSEKYDLVKIKEMLNAKS
jgi:long-chain acyl-CoA synthetase